MTKLSIIHYTYYMSLEGNGMKLQHQFNCKVLTLDEQELLS